VYVVHEPRKLLERVGTPARAEPADPTTVLGEWYATVRFWKRQVGLFVNESTLLPVLLPLAPAATVVVRFPTALATVLRRHGIGEASIERECEAMSDHDLATTSNRSVVGMMTEFAVLAGTYAESEEAVDLRGSVAEAVQNAVRTAVTSKEGPWLTGSWCCTPTTDCPSSPTRAP
jgi:hypothetical protein